LVAAQNTLVALILALCVSAVTRIRRVPPLAHLLWLLVLLKLVSPPVLPIDMSRLLGPRPVHVDGKQAVEPLRDEPPTSEHLSSPRGAVPKTDVALDQGSRPSTAPPRQNADEPAQTAIVVRAANRFAGISVRAAWDRSVVSLFSVWLGGAILLALVVVARIFRFEQGLKGTLRAPERIQNLVHEVACKLGVRRTPDVRCAECVDVPLLWWAGGRPTVVLPFRLLQQCDDEQVGLILAHELAHLRRRDHWVRAIELIVSIVYWWNPLAWAVRRQIHQAEDLCCDAWVRWVFPECTTRYAETVLKTAELLNAPQVGPRLLPASPFLGSDSLKARIEMLLQSRFAPGPSKKSLFVVGLLALVVLPTFSTTAQTQAQTPSKTDTPATSVVAAKPDRPSGSEFPYIVKFEQGASKLLDGDKIDITEVRGTAATFALGNIYWIRGTYTLASRDKAMLLAATTAADSRFGTGSTLKVQQAVVDRGIGAFTLFLPMTCQGWPHVSFYPAGGGPDFGGTYFGTGEFVLRKWWGSDGGADSESSLSQLATKIRMLGGTFERGEGLSAPVTGINFAGSRHLTDDDLVLLAFFKNLTTLGLGHTGITDAGLAKIGGMTQLTTLYIDNTQITDAGLKELKKIAYLRNLGLGHTRATDAGLLSVRDLTNLTTLYIDNTAITGAGLKELKTLKKLTTLGLGHTQTTDAGLKTIRDCWDLTTLYIDNTQITDAGLKDLGRLTNLRTLGVGHTRITDEGLGHLSALKNLRKLYLDHTQVTDSGVAKLMDSLPKVEIVR